MMPISPEELLTLPKAELHCHLDGIVDPEMLRELHHGGSELPVAADALDTSYPVTDFESFLRWYVPLESFSGRLDLYRQIIALHIERLRQQGAVYAEVMIASGELPLDPAEAVDTMTAFRAWVDAQQAQQWLQAQQRGEIKIELLVAFNRARPPERAAQIAERNIRLYEAGLIAGVALAGPERGFPVKPLAATFDRYHESGMGIEIHASEWMGPESAWDALEHGHPRRIGHGTHIFEDPHLVETLLERGIHVEMCPTSNVCTGSITRLEDHPIRRAFDLGMSVSVSSDDPGAFRCTLGSEYALLAERFGFTTAELSRVTDHALAARFRRRALN